MSAQLFFIYGTMNSGKSTQLLSTAHNYKEQGKRTLLLSSALDTRSHTGDITSRIGLSEPAIMIEPDTDLEELPGITLSANSYDAILVDEAQFLSSHQIGQLASIVDSYQIPVMAYGLKNDFSNHLFPGSEELLILADKLIELKTTCYWCNRKATMNLRVVDGNPVYDGEQIKIGGNESYISVCRNHFSFPRL